MLNCNTQKINVAPDSSIVLNNKIKIESISYSEYTRGTKRLYKFTPKLKTVSINEQVTNSPNTEEEWNILLRQTESLDLSKISSLKSPTTDRYSDAAFASGISIIKDGKVFSSSSFDAGRPPKELENLYNELKNQTRLVSRVSQKSR